MKSLLKSTAIGLVALALVACGGFPWAEPERASENYRLDLSPGVVAAFVEGLTPGMPGEGRLRYPCTLGHPGPSRPEREAHTPT